MRSSGWGATEALRRRATSGSYSERVAKRHIRHLKIGKGPALPDAGPRSEDDAFCGFPQARDFNPPGLKSPPADFQHSGFRGLRL